MSDTVIILNPNTKFWIPRVATLTDRTFQPMTRRVTLLNLLCDVTGSRGSQELGDPPRPGSWCDLDLTLFSTIFFDRMRQSLNVISKITMWRVLCAHVTSLCPSRCTFQCYRYLWKALTGVNFQLTLSLIKLTGKVCSSVLQINYKSACWFS